VNSATNADDVSILTALADPIRLDIVKRLSKVREVAGVDLARQLGISRALLCHHAGILVSTGLATRRKAGQTGYLSLNTARLRRCLGKLTRRTRASKRPAGRFRVGTRAVRPKLR
jgi:DNA-binding transcriptional ArsR family regulator